MMDVIAEDRKARERYIYRVGQKLNNFLYLRYGGVVNNQIKTCLLLSLGVKKIKIGEYLVKLQAKT